MFLSSQESWCNRSFLIVRKREKDSALHQRKTIISIPNELFKSIKWNHKINLKELSQNVNNGKNNRIQCWSVNNRKKCNFIWIFQFLIYLFLYFLIACWFWLSISHQLLLEQLSLFMSNFTYFSFFDRFSIPSIDYWNKI